MKLDRISGILQEDVNQYKHCGQHVDQCDSPKFLEIKQKKNLKNRIRQQFVDDNAVRNTIRLVSWSQWIGL